MPGDPYLAPLHACYLPRAKMAAVYEVAKGAGSFFTHKCAVGICLLEFAGGDPRSRFCADPASVLDLKGCIC